MICDGAAPSTTVDSLVNLTWASSVAATTPSIAPAATASDDDDDVDGVGGNDDAADDNDKDSDDVDDERLALQFSNTAHVSVVATVLLFALSF